MLCITLNFMKRRKFFLNFGLGAWALTKNKREDQSVVGKSGRGHLQYTSGPLQV